MGSAATTGVLTKGGLKFFHRDLRYHDAHYNLGLILDEMGSLG